MIRLAPFRRLVDLAAHISADPADSDDLRLQKTLLVFGSFMFIPAGVIWGVIYFLFGEPLAGVIPLSYSIFSTISIALKPFQQLEAMLAHKLPQRQMGLAFCPLTAYTYLA